MLQPVEEPRHRPRRRRVTDRVVSGVAAQRFESAPVGVAQRSQVELLHPAGVGVHARHLVEDRGAVAARGLRVRGLSPHRFPEDPLDLPLRVRLGIQHLEPVIGQPAAGGVEVRVTLRQCGEHAVVTGNLPADALPQVGQPAVQPLRVVHGQGMVGAKARHHRARRTGLPDALVVLQAVGRVVGGADHPHVHHAQQPMGAKLRLAQPVIAGPVDPLGRPG